MLIPIETVRSELAKYGIVARGVFHVGAHDCEELEGYNRIGISSEYVVWIEAVAEKVLAARSRGIPNVHHAIVAERDGVDVTFHISNNVQSSSILEFGTHATEHPWVQYVSQFTAPGVTVDTFFAREGLDRKQYNLWNFDIQGAELMALRGARTSLAHADALYLEVNEKELYKGCGLLPEMDAFLETHGFRRILTEMTSHGWGDALYIRIKK
jgi:FkbM family methyltransferase